MLGTISSEALSDDVAEWLNAGTEIPEGLNSINYG